MHADRQADGRTDTRKIVGTLHNYANAPTKKNAVITKLNLFLNVFVPDVSVRCL
jgi:hypothetical protein